MHPSPDPVNALLSLGYTLVTNELASLAEAIGFDPFIGFLHGFRYGRQSLPLDLVEEFRQPIVDMLTLNLLNKRVLSPDDFIIQKNKAMYLTKEGLKKYLAAYEKRMTKSFVDKTEDIGTGDGDKDINFRDCLKRQVSRLQKTLLYKKEYVPFLVQ